MNQRVDVYNRLQIENLTFCQVCYEDCPVLISISQPGDPLGIPHAGAFHDVLRLEFWDLDKHNPVYPDAVLFSGKHAAQISKFVEDHNSRSFIVHCDAGISRSVAVGLWISETLEIPLHLHAVGSTDYANGRVLRNLRRMAWKTKFGIN